MNTEHGFNSSQDDDVVFENRNKEYGAYSIRKSYYSRVSKGSGASLLIAGLLLAAIQLTIITKPETGKPILPPPFEGTLIPKPIIILESRPRNEIYTQPKTNAKLPPRVVTTPVEDPHPTEITEPATPTGSNSETIGTPATGRGVDAPSELTIVEPPKTVDFAEVMPEFEGGTKALYKFLRKTLRYPKAAERSGQEGTVFVRFIVDVTGSITGVEVIRNVAGVLDAEASRVIGSMPKWKPGTQHGSPVNVRMVLPIKFELNRQ